MGPMVRVCEKTGGIPPAFWEDATILGFMSGYIHGCIHVLSSNKYTGADAGEITMGVIDAYRGQGGGIKAAKMMIPMMADPVFKTAGTAGFLSAMITRFGFEKVADEPLVVEARSRAKGVPDVLNRGLLQEKDALAHELMHRYFYDPVLTMQAEKF
jgi:hypothetical protein